MLIRSNMYKRSNVYILIRDKTRSPTQREVRYTETMTSYNVLKRMGDYKS
jgi:hypothetical protein